MSRIDSSQHDNKDPLKWKKHLMLVDWKIRDREHLLNSINRYPINEYLSCLKDISKDITEHGGQYSFVIKLVSSNHLWKLPNIIVSSIKDLEDAEELIKCYKLSEFVEIWYCKNLTQNNDTVFGRMLLNNNVLFPSRCSIRFEIVWSTSARTIEQYPLINCSFIAFERDNWNAPPIVSGLNSCNMKVSEMISISKKIIAAVSAYTPQIIEFGSYVFSCGCNQLCLEYSYCNDQLNFIDWDTDDDNKVLVTLRLPEESYD